MVGAKLSKLQAILLSLLYFLWANAFAITAIAHLQELESLIEQYSQYIHSQLFFLPWSYFGIFVSVGGVLICFGFIYATMEQKLRENREHT
jgi:hypothetical protein